MISTFVDHAGKAVGKRFFVTAFLPTVVIATVASIELWGIEAIRQRLANWAERPVGEAIFDIAATLVGIFLVAYVFDSLRWSVRAVFEGTWPAPLRRYREWAVLRMLRKCERRTSGLQATLDRLAAVKWIKQGLGTVSYAEPFQSPHDAVRALTTARSHIRIIAEKARHRDLNRIVQAAHCLWRLQGNRSQIGSHATELDELLGWLKGKAATKEAAASLDSAELRLEQRRVWFDERLELNFPQRADTQPTQLGNVMARADSYSATRYGIPLRELWPRLEIFVDDAVLAQVDDSLSRVDFGLAMTTGGLGLSILGTASFLTGGPAVGLILATASLGGCILAYRFAVLSGEAYGKRISAAVDIYRRETLWALGVEPPLSVADERQVWDQLHHFLARGDDLDLRLVRFQPPDRKKDGEAAEPVSSRQVE